MKIQVFLGFPGDLWSPVELCRPALMSKVPCTGLVCWTTAGLVRVLCSHLVRSMCVLCGQRVCKVILHSPAF